MATLTGVTHLGLTVRDLRASQAWYQRVFGFERVGTERGPHFEGVVLRDPGSEMVISLRHHFGAGSARFDETRTGLEHVSFGVPDRASLDVWQQRLADLAVEHGPITESEAGWTLVLRDPDHIALELTCRKRPALRVAAPLDEGDAQGAEVATLATAGDVADEPTVLAAPSVDGGAAMA